MERRSGGRAGSCSRSRPGGGWRANAGGGSLSPGHCPRVPGHSHAPPHSGLAAGRGREVTRTEVLELTLQPRSSPRPLLPGGTHRSPGWSVVLRSREKPGGFGASPVPPGPRPALPEWSGPAPLSPSHPSQRLCHVPRGLTGAWQRGGGPAPGAGLCPTLRIPPERQCLPRGWGPHPQLPVRRPWELLPWELLPWAAGPSFWAGGLRALRPVRGHGRALTCLYSSV